MLRQVKRAVFLRESGAFAPVSQGFWCTAELAKNGKDRRPLGRVFALLFNDELNNSLPDFRGNIVLVNS